MKTHAPARMNENEFKALKKREQTYIILLYQRKRTKAQIKAKLFIESERTFQRLQKKVRELIRHFVAN